MSFFDDASLIYIADFAAASASVISGSGTDTGKAYSIKPTDGSGDFSVERGSDITATRVNSSGYIEKGRGNFLLQSNNFDTSWTLSSTDVIEGQSGYDGSNDAWILNSTTTGSPRIEQNVSLNGVSTFSVYASPSTDSFIQMRTFGAASEVYFDLNNGVVANSVGAQLLFSNIESAGNGYYRCSVTVNGSLTSLRIYPASAVGTYSTSGSGVFIQDTQLEQGLVATDVIETTTVPLRAGLLEDEPRFDYHNSASASPNTCPSLLLEPSRTNLITNSEYIDASTDWNVNSVTVEDNSITSPENQTNATKLTGTGGSSQRRIYQSFSQVSGEDFTISIFAKEDTENILFLRLYNTTDNVYANASFNLSTGVIASNSLGTAEIENYGNGWYRCILTGTPSTTTTTGGAYFNLTSDGNTTSTTSLYLWGAQIEQASYATSYIPTYGTAATRGQETIVATGIGSLIGQESGSLYAEYEGFENTSNVHLAITDGTFTNSVAIGSTGDRFRFFYKGNAITISEGPYAGSYVTNTRFKYAVRYKSTDSKVIVSGSNNTNFEITNTDAFASPVFSSTVDTAENERGNNSSYFFGRLYNFIIFKDPLSDEELKSITTI